MQHELEAISDLAYLTQGSFYVQQGLKSFIVPIRCVSSVWGFHLQDVDATTFLWLALGGTISVESEQGIQALNRCS